MKLYTNGIKLPKLGSVEDRVIRQFLTKESEKESKKTQLLALIAVQALPSKDDQVKKVWSKYLELEYGVEIPEHTEQELDMMKYYEGVVKHIKPKLSMKNGKMFVSGFESFQ